MMNLQIRGFTKVQDLLNGFENESDFMVSRREPDESVLDQSQQFSSRNRTGTMVTISADKKQEFLGLIEQSRKLIDDLKVMENEREIADKPEDDIAQPIKSPSPIKDDDGGIQFINEGIRVNPDSQIPDT